MATLSRLRRTRWICPQHLIILYDCGHRLVTRQVPRSARWINSKFHPQYVIADAGYSSEAFRKHVKRQYRAVVYQFEFDRPGPSL